MKENDSRILVSKELEGQIPDIEGSLSDYLFSAVCIYLKDSNASLELDGPITSFSISNEININMKMQIDKAFHIMKLKSILKFDDVNFILKDSSLKLNGDYTVQKAKMLDINVEDQECILELIIKSV